MTEEQRYKLSFTSTTLGLIESVNVAEVYLSCLDWKLTKEIIRKQNILQSRTTTRNTRVTWEVYQRLSLLTDNQLVFLVEGSLEGQRLLLWFAICNRYKFICDFAIEVLHEKFLAMDIHLGQEDYQAFYLRKLDWHPELEEITKTTQYKLRWALFKMMREAGLLSENFQIIRVIPSLDLVQALRVHPDFDYRIYPAFPADFEV